MLRAEVKIMKFPKVVFLQLQTKFAEIKSVQVLEFKVQTNADSGSWVNFGSVKRYSDHDY